MSRTAPYLTHTDPWTLSAHVLPDSSMPSSPQVERISALEQQHAQLLAQLPPHLQAHWQARHEQAAAEGPTSGNWVFPPLIYDEAAFRASLGSGSSGGGSHSSGGSGGSSVRGGGDDTDGSSSNTSSSGEASEGSSESESSGDDDMGPAGRGEAAPEEAGVGTGRGAEGLTGLEPMQE